MIASVIKLRIVRPAPKQRSKPLTIDQRTLKQMPIVSDAPVHLGGKRHWSREEIAAQRTAVEQMMLSTSNVRVMRAEMLRRFGVRSHRTDVLRAWVYSQWKVEGEQAREINKARVVQRLETVIRETRGERRPASEGGGYRIKPNWMANLRAEELLAKIEGTEAPLKVEETHRFDFVIGQAAAAVIANLTAEQLTERLQRARERKALAERNVVVEQTEPNGLQS